MGPRPRRPPAERLARAMLVALLGVFLAGHLWRFAPVPTDIDEANFVLGVRQFDVTKHQPHPPGYPVFVALGKLARPLAALPGPAPLAFGGPAAVEARALAMWAVLLGAAGLVALVRACRALDERPAVALAAAVFTAFAPLYWFTAARPLSDVPGLAAALVTVAWLLAARRRAAAPPDASNRARAPGERALRHAVGAAFLAGLAAGLRSQTVWLTAPLLLAIVATWPGARLRLAAAAGAAWLAGVAVWFVPMLALTGGFARYLDAAAWQAVEDLASVEMLARKPSVARAVTALQLTLGAPWATREMATIMGLLAGVGLIALLRRGARATGLLLAVAFGPYALFHLLWQEPETTRYALPLVPPMAYLAARGLASLAGRALPLATIAVAAALATTTLPAYVRYVGDPSPIFGALDHLRARLAASPETAVVAAHQPFRRALAAVDFSAAPVLATLPGREVSALADRWLAGAVGRAFLLNDPRRGAVRLVDPASREVTRFRWTFRRERYLRGIRPDLVDVVEIDGLPGWFCGEGWALTPDTGGLLHPERRAPHVRPAVAYVRRRPEATILVIGGRHLAPRANPRPAVLTAAVDGEVIASWTVRAEPDSFLEFVSLAPGRWLGAGPYATLTIAARADAGPTPPVGLEQFDVQSIDRPVWAYDDGWYLREYDERTGELWRWTSDRAVVRIHPGGAGDLTLTIAGQSPLAERGRAPLVTIRAGPVAVARLRPAAEFRETVRLPRWALDAAGGTLAIETDRVFVPTDWGLPRDERRLGLRVFELEIR